MGVSVGLDVIDIAALRYLVAGPVMIAVLLARRSGLKVAMSVGQGIAVAILLGPPFVLLSVGRYAFAPLAHGSVLLPAALTLGGLALSALVLREWLGRLLGTADTGTFPALVPGFALLIGLTLTGDRLAPGQIAGLGTLAISLIAVLRAHGDSSVAR